MRPIPEHIRAWLYRVSLALIPVLVAHGVLTESNAALYAGLVLAVLDVGLASANTSTAKEARP